MSWAKLGSNLRKNEGELSGLGGYYTKCVQRNENPINYVTKTTWPLRRDRPLALHTHRWWPILGFAVCACVRVRRSSGGWRAPVHVCCKADWLSDCLTGLRCLRFSAWADGHPTLLCPGHFSHTAVWPLGWCINWIRTRSVRPMMECIITAIVICNCVRSALIRIIRARKAAGTPGRSYTPNYGLIMDPRNRTRRLWPVLRFADFTEGAHMICAN